MSVTLPIFVVCTDNIDPIFMMEIFLPTCGIRILIHDTALLVSMTIMGLSEENDADVFNQNMNRFAY
jgi:hypothetical protein